MAFRDLRQFLGVLEAQGELARVRAEVDWNLELGAVSRRALDLRGPALLFESVKEYKGARVLANLFGRSKSSHARFALAMGMPAEAVAGMRSAPFWPALKGVAHTLAYDGTVMGDTMSGNPEPLKQWASVGVPTLVMVGSESPPYQQHAVRALVEILPEAQLRTLEGQTHDAAPEILGPVLDEFFAG